MNNKKKDLRIPYHGYLTRVAEPTAGTQASRLYGYPVVYGAQPVCGENVEYRMSK